MDEGWQSNLKFLHLDFRTSNPTSPPHQSLPPLASNPASPPGEANQILRRRRLLPGRGRRPRASADVPKNVRYYVLNLMHLQRMISSSVNFVDTFPAGEGLRANAVRPYGKQPTCGRGGYHPPANGQYYVAYLMRERNSSVTFPRRGRGTACGG